MDWPTETDALAVCGLSAAVADDPAWADALAAGQAECVRLAPRRFTDTGPDAADAWQAVCYAAALEYRSRGGDTAGYTEIGQLNTPTGDGWASVRRLLGLGYYARPRIG